MATDEASIERWEAHGLVLKAPNGIVPTATLLEFAQKAAMQHPDGVVQIVEFALRVTAYPDRYKGGPYLDWRD